MKKFHKQTIIVFFVILNSCVSPEQQTRPKGYQGAVFHSNQTYKARKELAVSARIVTEWREIHNESTSKTKLPKGSILKIISVRKEYGSAFGRSLVVSAKINGGTQLYVLGKNLVKTVKVSNFDYYIVPNEKYITRVQ